MAVDSFDYLESRDDADELITEFGAAANLCRITNSGTDYAPTQIPDNYPTFAVKVDFTLRQMQGGNVLATDERWLVAAGPLAALGVTSVLPGDEIVVGGVAKPVLESKPLAPAGVTVMFDCQIRN